MAGGSGGQATNSSPLAQSSQSQNSMANQTGVSPFAQQMANKQSTPFQQAGLEAIMSSFMNMAQPYQAAQPMQRGLMPTYQNPALSYRPDYATIQDNLTHVQPSVQEMQRRAAEEEARRRAEEEAYNAANPQPNPYDYGGGG